MIILKSNSMKIWESIFLNVYVLGKFDAEYMPKKRIDLFSKKTLRIYFFLNVFI